MDRQKVAWADGAEAAVRQAEAEGLTLQPSDNPTGYRGVFKHCLGGRAKRFQARGGRAASRPCEDSQPSVRGAGLLVGRELIASDSRP